MQSFISLSLFNRHHFDKIKTENIVISTSFTTSIALFFKCLIYQVHNTLSKKKEKITNKEKNIDELSFDGVSR